MSKRSIWVVEERYSSSEWCVWSLHETRKDARADKPVDCGSSFRVVKYVPAETVKKAGSK